MMAVRLSVLRTVRLYPPENIPGTHFCWRLSRYQGHIAIGRIVSMKNSDDTIRNEAALPQTTALLRTVTFIRG
jgi:hypothetical protein